jgi:hypothetical protein
MDLRVEAIRLTTTIFEKEESMNGFEEPVINEIANMQNIRRFNAGDSFHMKSSIWIEHKMCNGVDISAKSVWPEESEREKS